MKRRAKTTLAEMRPSALVLVHLLVAQAHRLGSPVCCGASSPAISFTSPEWGTLKKHLNTLPCFTCVNAKGEPLGYERDGTQLALYFADVERAQQELVTTSAKYPALNLQLMGVGLGDVFQQHTEGTAMLVPGAAALAGAGDEWDGETLPLYTCLALSSKAAEGAGLSVPVGDPTTPLFMCPNDAQMSLNAALETSRAQGASDEQLAQLQMLCTSLPAAVDIVLTGREAETCGDTFQFVAPRNSLFFLRDQSQLQAKARRRRSSSVAEDTDGLLFPTEM